MKSSRAFRYVGFLACLVIAVACGRHSPTEPAPDNGSFAGTWTGAADRGPCGENSLREDWGAAVITMQQSGQSITGEIVSALGAQHPLSGTVYDDHTELNVGGLPGTSTCSLFQLYVNAFQNNSTGRLIGFSGFLEGRCCGTVAGSFHFARQPGA